MASLPKNKDSCSMYSQPLSYWKALARVLGRWKKKKWDPVTRAKATAPPRVVSHRCRHGMVSESRRTTRIRPKRGELYLITNARPNAAPAATYASALPPVESEKNPAAHRHT